MINQNYWRGEDDCGFKALLPLAGAYLIRKSDACRRSDLTPSDLFAMALGAPYGPNDPYLADRATNTAKLLEMIPCYALDVPLDGNAIAQVIFGR